MSKDKISDYSSTANSNTDIAAINIDEGCAPSGINNAIRALMAQLKNWQSGAQDVYITPAGSASAPAVTTNGDTNTGVYFPAADKIALATGGTQAVIVDSSQNVGIGTSTLNDKCNLYSATSVYQRFQNSTTGTGATDGFQIGNDASAAYIWNYEAVPTIFATSNTERMRIDSSGNVGIGTSSPAFALDIANPTSNIRVAPSTTTNSALTRYVNAGGTGYVGLDSSAGGLTTAYSLNLYHSGAYPIVFSTNGAERARIDSSGNLLVGTTSGSTNRFQNDRSGDQTLYVTNTNASNPFGLYVSYAVAPNSTGSWFISCQDSVGNKMRVHSNGGIANYQANNVNLSDRREKTNFAPAGDYLAKICAIPVQTFNYIDQNMEEDGALTLGVIAQDVEAVAPELVMETDWGTKEEPKMRLSIYQTDLQYALMKCIQEQQAMIASQSELITTLTERITALEQA